MEPFHQRRSHRTRQKVHPAGPGLRPLLRWRVVGQLVAPALKEEDRVQGHQGKRLRALVQKACGESTGQLHYKRFQENRGNESSRNAPVVWPVLPAARWFKVKLGWSGIKPVAAVVSCAPGDGWDDAQCDKHSVISAEAITAGSSNGTITTVAFYFFAYGRPQIKRQIEVRIQSAHYSIGGPSLILWRRRRRKGISLRK